jgi:glutaredoxin 3
MNATTQIESTPQVTIYTSNDCHWCAKAKQYLTRRGVAYIERNAETDETAAQEVMNLTGHRGVPVIVIGDQVIRGFQRRPLDELLGLGALDAATEATLPPTQDAVAAAVAAGKFAMTPEQQASAAAFTAQVPAELLSDYLADQLDGSPTNCDHTFRHIAAFLDAHPVAGIDSDSLLDLLRAAGIRCDCGYVINVIIK